MLNKFVILALKENTSSKIILVSAIICLLCSLKAIFFESPEKNTKNQGILMQNDNGKLLITNKRIMFLGSNITTNIDINKIVSIEDYLDGIKIQRSNKQKPEYFIGVDNNSITINIEGRQHNVLFNGEMIREIIIGRLN